MPGGKHKKITPTQPRRTEPGIDIVVEDGDTTQSADRRDTIQTAGSFEVGPGAKLFCSDPYLEVPRVIVLGAKPGIWRVRVRKFREVVCWVVAYHEELGQLPNSICVQGIIEHEKPTGERLWLKEGYVETDVGFVGIFDSAKYQVEALVPPAVDYEPVLTNKLFFSHLVANVGKVTEFGYCCATGEGDFPCHIMRSSTGEAVAVRITMTEERDILRADRLIARAELAWPGALNDGSVRAEFHPDPDMSPITLARVAGPIRFLNEGLPRKQVLILFKIRRLLVFSFFFSFFLIIVSIVLTSLEIIPLSVQDWLMYFSLIGAVIPSLSFGLNLWFEYRLWNKSRVESFRRVDELNEGRSSRIPLMPLSAAAAADDTNVIWELKWSDQYVRVALFRGGKAWVFTVWVPEEEP